VNFAFSVAIAAAASGNIALIVDGSSPECLFAAGVGGGRVREFLEPSTLSLPIASLRRFDIGSVQVVRHNSFSKESVLTFVKVCRGQNSRHWMILSHLLENLDEEADLDLSCLLKKSIKSSSTLSLTQNPEPLLDGAQLVLKILVESSSGHLLQRGLILIDIRNPLLGYLV